MSKKQDLLYVMNPNCGWCKKADPVVSDLVADGYEITTVNVADQQDAPKAREVMKNGQRVRKSHNPQDKRLQKRITDQSKEV